MTRPTRRTPLLLAAAFMLAAAAPSMAARGSRDDWQQPGRVVADLGLKDGSVVADVGCGSGYFVFRLARAVGAGGKVYAQEISDRHVRSLKDRIARDKVGNVEAVKGEATRTGLPDAALDAALVVNVYHHVAEKDRPGLTADIARALKPGGYLYLVDWRVDATIDYDRDCRIPKDDLVKVMAGAGLALDAEFHYLPQQVFLRFRKPPAAK